MLHDVTFDVWNAAAGSNERHTVQVDADGGDDAASKGAVAAAAIGPAFKIIGIAPAGASVVVEAVVEGDDAPPEAVPAKRQAG